MKFEVVKSLFSDGNPYIDIKEGITENDVRFIKNTSDDDYDKFKNGYGNSIYLTYTCIPNQELIESLKDFSLYDRGKLQPLLKFVFWNKDYFENGKMVNSMNLSKDFKKDVRFTGLRSDAKKQEKFIKTYKDFTEGFDESSVKSEMLDEINSHFNRIVKEFNKKYIEETKSFYSVTPYQDYWDEILKKDNDYNQLSDDVDEIEDKIKKLRTELKNKKKDLKKITNDIVKNELLDHNVQEDVKKEIIEDLKNVEVKSDRFFGF